ncbi:histone H3.v1-like [Cynara cardunculus var. scolymus]|uniref:histone H3.v1-like n=1 Tax=Cynara cardunculus var. scolymus TaxID=59895 RepID=UPI000D630CE7|nr:histone H3.v1-like [Cynara cardunculus var. scolymus]
MEKKKKEAERAEEERAEQARQTEIARLREEARLRTEEEARQILAQSSSPNYEDNQEHYDDAARSYTSEENGEEEEESDEEVSKTECEGDEEESEEEDEEEEGGGEAVALSHGGTKQPRPNKHIRFTYPTPSATTLSDSDSYRRWQTSLQTSIARPQTAAKNINDTLARFNYRSDNKVRRVAVAVDELLKTIEEVIRSMPRAEDERPKR